VEILRVEHDDVAWPPGEGVAQVVEGATTEPIAVGAVSTMRATAPPVVTALDADLVRTDSASLTFFRQRIA
jgi:hypothetical protein